MKPSAALRIASIALFVLGFGLLLSGYAGAQDKGEVYEQIPYLISGGLGSLCCISLGGFLLHASETTRVRESVDGVKGELTAMAGRLDYLEIGLVAEFDHLQETIGEPSARQHVTQSGH